MSRHLTNCAADLELEPLRLKLAMLCFADSAKDRDHVALPGYDALAKWTGVKKSQVCNLINDLLELRLIARHKPAHRGQRAEYLVFPLGCCEVHGKQPAMVVEDGADVVAMSAVDDCAQPCGHRSMTFSTGSTSAVDPFEEKGSNPAGERVQSTGLMGPISAPERVHPPRSIPSASKYVLQVLAPTEQLLGSTQPQPLPPRETTDDEEPIDESSATGSAFRALDLDCPHCDGGQLHDRQGLPVGECPNCSARRRTRTRDSA